MSVDKIDAADSILCYGSFNMIAGASPGVLSLVVNETSRIDDIG